MGRASRRHHGQRIAPKLRDRGDAQTIADLETGAVLGRSTWTSAGPSLTLRFSWRARPAAIRPWSSAKRSRPRRLCTFGCRPERLRQHRYFALNANEFKPGELPSANAIWVGRRSKDEVDAACPRHGEVQWRTDNAADTMTREGNYRTASQYGTAVHRTSRSKSSTGRPQLPSRDFLDQIKTDNTEGRLDPN